MKFYLFCDLDNIFNELIKNNPINKIILSKKLSFKIIGYWRSH
ncbi:hypothetical protein GAPWKB11_1369 [Gilliamella apicola]|nr:hypothetical protein GAPWKB11_1369 [Gilliamella apicola]